MDGDDKANVELRNYCSCQSGKTSINYVIDAKCKVACAINEMKSALQKGECQVDLSRSISLSSLEELKTELDQLMKECFKLIKDHAMKHHAHGGRQATDSGFCNSADITTMTSLPELTVGIAERQDYPSNPDDHQPNSLSAQQSISPTVYQPNSLSGPQFQLLSKDDALKSSFSHC